MLCKDDRKLRNRFGQSLNFFSTKINIVLRVVIVIIISDIIIVLIILDAAIITDVDIVVVK